MLGGMDVEVIAIHSDPIAVDPVGIPLSRCITVFNEHPFLSVDSKDGTSTKQAEIEWVIDIKIAQVVVA